MLYSRTDIFKYSFFLSTISEWNKLDLKIRQSKTLLTFQNALIKIGRPIPKPIYNVHNPVGLKLLTRLRLGFRPLNQHKFNCNFQDCLNPLCSCSLEIECFLFLSRLSLLLKHTFNPFKWITVNWYKLVKSGRWYSTRNTSLSDY